MQTIQLIKYSGKENVYNKESQTGKYEILRVETGNFMELNVDLDRLTIIIKIENTDFNLSAISNANYLKWVETGNYYFILSKEFISGKLFRLNLQKDVLSSTKLNYQVSYLVERTSNDKYINRLLDDNLIQYEYKKVVTEVEPNDEDMVNIKFDSYSNGTCILNVAFYNYNEEGVILPTPTASIEPHGGLNGVTANNTDLGTSSVLYRLTPFEMVIFSQNVIKNSAFLAPIKLAAIYPFEINIKDQTKYKIVLPVFNSNGERIKLSDDCVGSCPQYLISPRLIISDFYLNEYVSLNDYKSFEPYTIFELYLPYCGWARIDLMQLKELKDVEHRIQVFYVVDYASGNATANVYDYNADMLLFSTSCNLGSKIGFTSSNLYDLINQRNMAQTNTTLTTLLGALTGFVGLATGNPLGIIASVKLVGGSVQSYVQNEQKAKYTHTTPTTQSVSANLDLYNYNKVRIRITQLQPLEYYGTNDFKNNHGLMCGQYLSFQRLLEGVAPNTLTYVKLSQLNDIEYLCDTIEEQRTLVDILTSGFYL